MRRNMQISFSVMTSKHGHLFGDDIDNRFMNLMTKHGWVY